MSILLDTHAFLWFLWDDPQLSLKAKKAICDPNTQKLISVATAWEVAIKVSLGKLRIGGPFRNFFKEQMAKNHFEWISIVDDHLDLVSSLPFHHRDPFDRMLIAQSIAGNISLVSADAIFDQYLVNRIW